MSIVQFKPYDAAKIPSFPSSSAQLGFRLPTVVSSVPQNTMVATNNIRVDGELLLVDSPEGDGSYTEQQVADAIVWNYEEAKKAKEPFTQNMRRLRDRYNMIYDHSMKDDWQAKFNFPAVKMAVERLASILTRILTLARDDWFSIYAYDPSLKPYFSLFKSMLQESFDSPGSDFFDTFSQAIKSGLSSQMMAVMVSWQVDNIENMDQPEVEKGFVPSGLFGTMEFGMDNKKEKSHVFPTSRLKMAVQNPENIFLDPTGRDRFKIRTSTLTKGEFREEGEARDYKNVEDIIASSGSTEIAYLSQQDKRRGVLPSNITKNDTIDLIEFWGKLLDKNGNIIENNVYAIVAKKKYIVKYEPNPFAHEENPIVTCSMIDDPFSVYGDSHISMALDNFELWNEFMNMVIDFYQTSLRRQYEINTEILSSDTDMSTGWHPGKIWFKNSSEPAVTSPQIADAPQSLGLYMDLIRNEKMENSGLNDAVSGATRSRGRISSQEFTRRMAESGALFDYTFRSIESKFLETILRQAFLNMLQYTPIDHWGAWINNKIAELRESDIARSKVQQDQAMQMAQQQGIQLPQQLPQVTENPLIPLYKELMNMSPQERVRKFGKSIYFKTEVFSAVYDRQAELEKVTFLMGTVARIPEAMSYIKWRYFLGRIVKSLGFEEDKALHTDEEAAQLRQYIMQLGTPSATEMEEIQQTVPPPNAIEGMATGVTGSSGSYPPGWNQMMPGRVQA